MGPSERLSVLQVDIPLVWEAMVWPSIMCMGVAYVGGFLNELRFCVILNEQNLSDRKSVV